MGEELIFLNMWPSMYGARVQVALEEKGLSYEHRQEDLLNKSPLLLEMNPVHKKIPVIIHNGKPVSESLNIVQYIDEVWNERAPLFLPSDPYKKAQARFWADFIDKTMYDGGGKIAWHKSKEDIEIGKKKLIETLKVLEGALGEQAYFGGETFGFVDIALVGFYMWFYSYETIANFSIEAECPKLVAWGQRCLERESVSKSLGHPEEVYGILMQMRQKYGIDQKATNTN